ncbi:MAG: hypothetical protein MUO50_00215 [Longimicrobiales bacterium]|nr:hypothetical protein [Longimicrobiales bacterium]
MTRRSTAYQRFFAELKRRRVFNSAALYGGVAFVVFQAADFVVPALHLSEAVATGIVYIAALGFLPAMVFAWFYDLTSGGMRLTNPPATGELEAIVAQPLLRRWSIGLAAAFGVVLLVGGVGGLRLGAGEEPENLVPSGEVPTIASVGVLPFLSLVAEEDGSFLSEGIANELLKALKRVPGLRVAGRTSAFSFNNTEIDLVSVAGELNVAWLLEGSVGEAGDTVAIAVRLVAAGDGDQSWTQSYQLPKEGFLNALNEVAWNVAGRLGAELPTEGRPHLVPLSTTDFRAYGDLLRGRYLAQQGTPDALESAITHYSRALLLDPEFGPAWSALATAYLLLPEYGGPPMMENLPYLQAALVQAMKPGREMPEGYAAAGYLNWAYLWDLSVAEEDFRKSLELDPSDPITHYWFAQLLTVQRRWDEGLAHADRALELDPLSAGAHMTRGLLLFCAGLEGASSSFRRALELAPNMHPAAYLLAGHLAMEGDLEGAAEEFDRFSSLTGTNPSVFRDYLAALAGSTNRADVVASFQDAGFYGPVQGAELLAYLGETDASLSLLERAVQARSPYLPWVNAMPEFEGLRSDSRFQSILAWVGF